MTQSYVRFSHRVLYMLPGKTECQCVYNLVITEYNKRNISSLILMINVSKTIYIYQYGIRSAQINHDYSRQVCIDRKLILTFKLYRYT